MKIKQIMHRLALLILSGAGSMQAYAAVPIPVTAVVRDGDGCTPANAVVSLRLSVFDAPDAERPLFVETVSATTDAAGFVRAMLGADNDNFDNLSWDAPRFLKIEADEARRP